MAIAYALFIIYTGAVRPMGVYQQRGVHLAFALTLAFLLYPASRKEGARIEWYDALLAAAAMVVGAYPVAAFDRIAARMGITIPIDIVFGAVMVLLILEATRRVLGKATTIFIGAFLLFAKFGCIAPFAHQGYSIECIVSQLYLTTGGIYGVPLGVSATFVIFAVFLSESGAGQFFIDIAHALFGRLGGGTAKAAIMASGLFGTISGSAVANVVGTGTVTIPLMKRVGYRPHFAGAVEAAASTGGQIMPPVMGAAAFIMAEILGLPYLEICIAALLPAVLYFLAVFFMVDFEAIKLGLKGSPAEALPNPWQVLKQKWYYIIPPFVLVCFLAVMRSSPMRSAIYALAATIAVSFVRKATRLTPARLLRILEKGARAVSCVAMACATAGIIVGIINLTGLGLRFSSLLIEVSRGSLSSLLFLAMLFSLILGTGLSATACYIILAELVAPALIQMGVVPIAAHLFVFYFGIISMLTPPVALAAHAGASMAGAPLVKTGHQAWRLALAGIILPFMFIYSPELLLIGHWHDIVLAVVSGVLGIYAFSAGIQGYMIRPANPFERVVLLISALLLIRPGLLTDLLGLGGIVIVAAIHLLTRDHRGSEQVAMAGA